MNEITVTQPCRYGCAYLGPQLHGLPLGIPMGGPASTAVWSGCRGGSEAGEVMAVVQTAMLADLPYPKLRDAILAHPTMAEGLGDLFAKVPPRSGP